MSDDPQHIDHTFDEELEKLNEMLLRMGSLVAQQLDAATATFKIAPASKQGSARAQPRSDLMDEIAQREKALNDLERRVQEFAINLAALRQPMASDLRTIIVAMKVSDAFEAMGDHCASIAERGRSLAHSPYREQFGDIDKLRAGAAQMLQGAIECCRVWDATRALKVWQKDRHINALHDSLLKDFSLFMAKKPESIASVVDFLSAVKYVERLGDRLKSIVEALHYAAEGETFAPPPLKQGTLKAGARIDKRIDKRADKKSGSGFSCKSPLS